MKYSGKRFIKELLATQIISGILLFYVGLSLHGYSMESFKTPDISLDKLAKKLFSTKTKIKNGNSEKYL